MSVLWQRMKPRKKPKPKGGIMSQLDNLDTTLRRLREERGWSHKKESKFVVWLDQNGHIKKGQRPGSKVVEDLFKKIQAFEEIYNEQNEH